MNQKGFANVVLIGVVVAIIVVGGYFVFVKKSRPVTQQPTPTTTQASTPTATPKNETASWKTYRSEKYGFEIQYPQDLTLLDVANKEFPTLGESADSFNFVIHDAKYVAPEGAVGQDVRFGYRLVHFSIVKFSPKILEQMKVVEADLRKRIASTDWDPNDVLPRKERIGTNDMIFYKELGAAGPYPNVYFYTNQYFVSADGWQDDLMKSLIARFKFTK